jgi:redox-sensitive bicupin YhaK (pirin superfamily)
MQSVLYKAADRGTKDIGWLISKFSFSFSSYQNPAQKGFGLLHTFNDDIVKSGGGFGLHPHTNMEIISVMLAGKMNHKDTMGYTEVVEKDWVQIMSAGSGLKHEEHNIGDTNVNFLQIWIEPKLQNINPRYQKRYFAKAKRKNAFQTIVSNEEGVEHCWINQNAKLSLCWLEKEATQQYNFLPNNKCVFIFILDGTVAINEKIIEQRDAIGIWDTSIINFAAQQETEFIVVEIPINH